VPALTESLKDPDARIRYYAAKALGKIGPDARNAVSALKSAMQDNDKDTRQAATDAIKRIEGRG
jgi:HEAT repeat protein